jgi:8-amino-7-oxononanoate synthase
MFADFIDEELQALTEKSLFRRLRSVADEQGPLLTVDGQSVLNFSSNNYLGLANHPRLRLAAKEAIDRYGCGSGASRLISGNMTLHEELEHKIALLKGTEAALVFNSGFQANTGIIPALVAAEDVVFSDSLNHASIIDGCRLARGKTVVYPHCDMNALEQSLNEHSGVRRKLIVTESVFSMDGDEAPLREIVELAEKHGAGIMADEAHATGVFEPRGAGLVAKLGLGDRVLVQMGTLGKALGGFGAFVAGSKKLREFLVNRCRSFIFTTALPPAVMAMGIAAIDIVFKEPERRERLRENSELLRAGLECLEMNIGNGGSHILPIVIGDAGACMTFSERLLSDGLFAQGIRPPTVPAGTSRLRMTVMATHTPEHIQTALKVFKEVKSEYDVFLRNA